MARLTDAEYAAMADDYEINPPTADEVLAVAVTMGRPRGDAARRGKSPSMSVRFPAPMRDHIRRRAAADFDGNEGELVRAAVSAFLAGAITGGPSKKVPPLSGVAERKFTETRPSGHVELSDHTTHRRSALSETLDTLSPPSVQDAAEVGMTNKRVVQQRPDGDWEVRKPGADRASAVTSTQADGIDRARDILANDGGGEMQVRGRNGQIRAQDTIAPGNDPRSSEG